MATKPPTGTKAKPPKGIDDREIGDHEHDELVNWLIRNRAEVVNYQFTPSDEEINDDAEKARAEWKEKWDSAVEQIKTVKNRPRVGNAAEAILARAEKWLASFKAPPFPPEVGKVIIDRWSTQTEIYAAVTGKEGNEKIVGFVDVVFEIKRQEIAMLSSPGWPGYLWNEPEKSAWFVFMNLESDPKEFQEFKSTKFSECIWKCERKKYRIYYDVRVKLPTLGETLQSLKTLQDYVGDDSVCLFAKEIPEFWREVLSNEGFLAMSQQEILESIGK